jgi:CRP-like cAMP-binding protein
VEWPILAGLPPADRRQVLEGARRRRFAPDEVLFHQGDPAASLHLVTTGRVAVRLMTAGGESFTVDVLAPGDVLGELALLVPGATRSATAVALEPTETLVLDRSVFDRLRREVPGVTEVLIRLLVDRVRHLDARLVEALYVQADVRVLRRLLELTTMYGPVVPLRQEDLAGLAGTTRASVNRVLRRMERSGAVALGRARVEVLDGAAVARAAGLPPGPPGPPGPAGPPGRRHHLPSAP